MLLVIVVLLRVADASFFAAAHTIEVRAQEHPAHLLNISLHESLIAKLIAHGLVGLFGIRLSIIAGLFVEVADCGPAAGTRIVISSDVLFGKVDIYSKARRRTGYEMHAAYEQMFLQSGECAPH